MHQGRIKVTTHIDTPEQGYCNMYFDPVKQKLILKFDDGKEKIIGAVLCNKNETPPIMVPIINAPK